MATSSFERKIVIADPKSIEKLAKIMADDYPAKPLNVKPYSSEERRRSEELLKEYLSRSCG